MVAQDELIDITSVSWHSERWKDFNKNNINIFICSLIESEIYVADPK